jgi:hypothetical protein
MTLQRKLVQAVRNPSLILHKAIAFGIVSACRADTVERIISQNQNPKASRFHRVCGPHVFTRWVEAKYAREPDPEHRDAMRNRCMNGSDGMFVERAKNWNASGRFDRTAQIGSMSMDDAFPWLPALDTALARSPDATVIQIGCCSGLETAYFAERFPHVQFIGTDVNELTLESAVRSHQLPNINFKVCPVHKTLELVQRDAPLIVFDSGTLTYVQPEYLSATFRQIAKRGNTLIISGNPWEEGGLEISPGRTRWRANFSYSHEYDLFAKEAGLDILDSRKIRPFSDPANSHKQVWFLMLRA